MNTSHLLEEIAQLPPEAQLQVEEFVTLIKKRLQAPEIQAVPSVIKGDKTQDPTELFGIWAAAPKRLVEIRSLGWKRQDS